jgi:alkylation response protein AidB-like acyl-CoA dehydrogenase
MFFELTEEQRVFLKRVREIYEREVTPLVEESERSETFPGSLFRILGQERLLCLRCPKEYDGPGLNKVYESVSVEELNRICAGIGSSIMVHGGLAVDSILHFGSKEMKTRYLPPAVRGEKVGAFAVTEPNAGSDLSGIRTVAIKEGRGYRLSGSKTFITNGTICDFMTVAAYTDPTKKGTGISLFVVERGDPGFTATRKLRKLGNHSSETAEIAFQDSYVPKERMIGSEEGRGLEQLEETLKSARITYGARSTGIGQAAFDATVSFVKEEGMGRSSRRSQAVRFLLAEMAVSIDAMRTMAYRAAWLYDQGVASMKDASVVKLFCTESLQKVVQKAMALQKSWGLTMTNPVQRFLRDARLLKIPEGTSEIQHLIIARELGI